MRILFTGATSFTGAWFARGLAGAGHSVVAAMRGPETSYQGLRRQRLDMLAGCDLRWDMPFGGEAFLAAIEAAGPFDLLCHHAADATDYKSPDFDTLKAADNNCRNLPHVLARLRAGGCNRVLLTGSVFEADEGAGEPRGAFSPYGLSKSITAAMFRFYAAREGMALGKFVIPNPFGPLEEPRFCDYLLRCWAEKKPARVNTPDYVRDNIPVSLLTLAYCDFAAAFPATGYHALNPSFYVESQGAFAGRFAREIGSRLGIGTPLELARQTDFAEPMIRINCDRVMMPPARWDESAAWDAAADYYRGKFSLPG